MIGTIDIKVNAAHPEMPLAPFYAFVNSPSQVRIVNVPRSIGDWKLTAVYITANYPDNTSRSVACTLTGGCWHGTLAAATATGTAANGFTVTANGVMEDGETTVSGYVLGKGDLYVLDTDATLTVGDTTYYAHLVDEEPTTPHKGDLCVIDNVYKLYNGSAWVALGSSATVSWDDIEDKPSTFAPTAHASTHASGGTDAITPAAIGAVATSGGTLTGGLTAPYFTSNGTVYFAHGVDPHFAFPESAGSLALHAITLPSATGTVALTTDITTAISGVYASNVAMSATDSTTIKSWLETNVAAANASLTTALGTAS